MAKQTTVDPKLISFEAIRTLGKTVHWSEINENFDKLPDGFDLKFNYSAGYSDEDNKNRYVLDIGLFGNLADGKDCGSFIRYIIEFIVRVENFKDLASFDEDKKLVTIDAMLSQTLLSLCYSTARGIIQNDLADTPFAGVILPVVAPTDLLAQTRPAENQDE